jgi:hypothetical protein
MRIASVALEDQAGTLRAGAPRGLGEDVGCLPVAPVFSPEGWWIYCVEQAGSGRPRVRRLPLPAVDEI